MAPGLNFNIIVSNSSSPSPSQSPASASSSSNPQTIYVEAGWGVRSSIEAAAQLRSTRPLKDLKITVELRGMIETRWSGEKPMIAGESLPTRFSKRFLHLTEVVRDKKEVLQPNEFGMITLPFKMDLPANGLPPTYNDRASSINYYFKAVLIYQESMKLMKTHKEMEIPIVFRMPETTRIHLLTIPSPIDHSPPPSPDKCGYSIYIPHRALQPGDTLEADVSVFSAPQNGIVRSVSVSVKTSIEYIGQVCNATVSLAKPLAEAAEVVGGSVMNSPWVNRFSLKLDPAICRASFESSLITIRSYFYLEIFLKGSEVANVAVEIPIVIVPLAKGETRATPILRGSMGSDPSLHNPSTPPLSALTPSPSLQYSNSGTGGMIAPSAGIPGSVLGMGASGSGSVTPFSSSQSQPQTSNQDALQQQQALFQMYQMQLAYQVQHQQSGGVPQDAAAYGGSNISRSMSERQPSNPGRFLHQNQASVDSPVMLRRAATNAASVPFVYNQPPSTQYVPHPLPPQPSIPYPGQAQIQGSPQWDSSLPLRKEGGSISDSPARNNTMTFMSGYEQQQGDWNGHQSPVGSFATSSAQSSVDGAGMTAEGMLDHLLRQPSSTHDTRMQRQGSGISMASHPLASDRVLNRMPSGTASTVSDTEGRMQNLLTRSESSSGTALKQPQTPGKSSALNKMDALLSALSAMTEDLAPSPPTAPLPAQPVGPLYYSNTPSPSTSTASTLQNSHYNPPLIDLPTPPSSPMSPQQRRNMMKEPKRYRVVAEYTPQMDDELELFSGQVLIIRKIYGDGWASGLNLSTGREGTFPLQNIEGV
ncbi:E3 ubiquitin-protein ligase sh3rf1 [Dinochytrium kinnereticum]|nr:E3 ubiquitin-protein ligase sh3rf1 [Dinochytrium kinnereticum]